jgi:hypothetical protein
LNFSVFRVNRSHLSCVLGYVSAVVRTPMRIYFAISLLMLLAIAGFAQPNPAEQSPAAADRNEARWADWEAQARIADGDYDGAVQAEQQADTARYQADRHDTTGHLPR